MLNIQAEIYLKREDEGGMTKEGFSGMMPSFYIENERIMCKVTSSTEQTVFKRGEIHQVNIQLPYGEDYEDKITNGYRFTLHTGRRVIAVGKVISIV